ncbi:hypothetical protein HS125_04600 [bacterium]|nr:hypothetical protein [bacterium]
MQVQPTETGEERVVLLAEMEASPLWPRTRGRLEVYTVEDDSLDPYLPHNCRLYVRAPRSLSAVPEGAVCIWRHEGALLVRQLRWVLEGRRKKLAVARSLAPWRGADLYLPTGQVDIVGVALGYRKLDGAFSTPLPAVGGRSLGHSSVEGGGSTCA